MIQLYSLSNKARVYDRPVGRIRAEFTIEPFVDGAPGPRTFEATVRLLEPIGSDTYVELAVGDTSLVSRAAPDIAVTLGQVVRARMSGRIHLFGRATGERIGA